ncbi:MAG: hypothetical protein K2X39_08170, partial [Silvanigrellaceae bacterium]|nr:hypothetical protein [Silvanigrellaceae bacterium]
QVLISPKISVTYLGFNFRYPLLKHHDIREAIALGINRSEILQYRLQNLGILANGIFSKECPFYNKNIPDVKYDPKKAKDLIAKSKIQHPEFSLAVSSLNRSTVEIAKAIANNLKQIGISITLHTLENTIFTDRINKGSMQLWIANWVGFKDPDHLRFIFSSNMIPPHGRNRGAYSNGHVDKLLAQGREEFDMAKRKVIYDKAQEIIYKDYPYVNLWHSLNTVVLANNIKGYKPYADGRYWSIVEVTKQ